MTRKARWLVFLVAIGSFATAQAQDTWNRAQGTWNVAALPGIEPPPLDPPAASADGAPGDAAGMNVSKSIIERPIERLLERTVPDLPREAAPVTPVAPESGKVAPGRVGWHPDLAAAQGSARVTGKPVLLFVLLGKLDDAFC